MTAASFVVMVVSGLVAYIVPHGRVAYWTHWQFLGLSKTNWDDVHILSSIVFLVAAIVHIYLNRKPLLRAVSAKIGETAGLRKEPVLAIMIGVFVFISAVYHVPPLSYLLDLNAYIKTVWVPSKEHEPPFGHAELLSLRTLTMKQGIPLDEAVKALKTKGIEFSDPGQSLEEIAKANKKSPMAVYDLIRHLEPAVEALPKGTVMTPQTVEEKFAGSGVGRKSLREICDLMSMDTADIQKRLISIGITVKDDEGLKQAADRNKLPAIELLKVILVEGYKPKK